MSRGKRYDAGWVAERLQENPDLRLVTPLRVEQKVCKPVRRAAAQDRDSTSCFPPGAAMGTQLPLHLSGKKSSHEHWIVKAKRTKFQRQYVYEKLMRLWEEGPLLGLPLVVTITRIAPRALDEGDNLSYACSAVRDAISDWLAGQYLQGDDRQDELEWRYEQRRVVPGFYAVEIRVERPKR